MMLDGNLDLLKGMKRTENDKYVGKYKRLLMLLKMSLKDNCLKKDNNVLWGLKYLLK